MLISYIVMVYTGMDQEEIMVMEMQKKEEVQEAAGSRADLRRRAEKPCRS